MVLARIGVAAGEAGGVNPIYSIVGDYYPPEKRATPLAIVGLGMGLGPSLVGMISQYALPFMDGDNGKSLGLAIGCTCTFYILGCIMLFYGSKTVKTDIETARNYDSQQQKNIN